MNKHIKYIIYLISLMIMIDSLGISSLWAQNKQDSNAYQDKLRMAVASPDASLGVLGLTVNQVDTISFFQLCSSYASEILTFTNNSTTSTTNSSYNVSWGDGSADFAATSWTSQTHTYKPGHWILTFTVTGTDQTVVSKRYHIYIVSNPAVSLGSPGNTDNCSDVPLTFPITGTENNPPNTTYTVSFNDGTASIVYQNAPPKEITHTFTKSSCGTNSTSGSTTYPNSFSATIVASNSCGVSSVTVVPIYISTAPVVSFDLPKTTLATNTAIYITNKTTGYVNSGANCSVVPKLVWKITPSTGFTLNGGSLGTDNNSDNSNLWVKGSDIIVPVFTKPGIYTIKLRVDTKRCGTDSLVKTVCVEAPLSPKYDLDITEGCAPLTVKTTNTTDLTTTCSFTTAWSVSYTAGYGGSLPVNWTLADGCSASGTNSGFVLKTPGTYKIRLSMVNTAGTYYIEKTVIVKQPPVVSVNSIVATCGVANIHPTATINTCTPTTANVSYLWEFPGGTPSQMTTLDPGYVKYNSPGIYPVKLTVTNECGSTVATRSFTVNSLATISPINSQYKNAGQASDVVAFSSSESSTFSWVNSNTKIGLASSGTGNINSFVLQNNTDSVIRGKVTVTAVSKITGCTGNSQTFEYVVNPVCDMIAPTDLTVVNGDVVPEIVFSTDNKGGVTSYVWAVDSTSIGIPGAGIGNIGSFTAINNTNKTIVATIIVIPNFISNGVTATSAPYTFTITILPTPQVNKIENLEFCNGNDVPSIKFTTNIQDQVVTYKWTNKNTKIGLAASGSGNIPAFRAVNTSTTSQTAIITVTPYYESEETMIAGTPQTFRITVNTGASIKDQPQSIFVCRGGKADSLRVTYENGTSTPTYQWYVNSNNANYGGRFITGATQSSYMPSVLVNGTSYYYCVVSFQTGLCKDVVSHTATVQVNDAAYITQQPQNKVVCVGGSSPLYVKYEGGSGKANFQWYANTINSVVGATAIPDATDSVFYPSAFTAIGHYYYFVQLTKSGDGCGTIYSNAADVEVIASPVINQQPISSQSVCKSYAADKLTVVASGGAGYFSYQWFVSSLADGSKGQELKDATDSIYVPLTDSVGTFYYYCQVSQPNSPGCTLTTSVSQVVVNSMPVITSQPISVTMCASENVDPLIVRYTNGIGKANYQWYVSVNNISSNGTLIPGANASTYQPDVTLSGTVYYYCVISFTDGGCASVTSETAAVTINPVTHIQSRKIAVANALNYTFRSNSSFGDMVVEGTKYSWTTPKLSNQSAITGATSQISPVDSISFKLVNSADTACKVTYTITPLTGTCIGSSFTLEVTVGATLKVNATIQNVTCAGSATGVITSKASGGLPFKSGDEYIYNWIGPDDFASNTNNISSLKAGSYTLVVTDSVGNVATAVYQVSSPLPIVVTLDDKQNTNCAGANSGKISVTVSGGVAPYSFKWVKDSVFYSSTEDLVNLKSGDYQLTVTDANGCDYISSIYRIVQPDSIRISILSKTDISCYGDSSAFVIIGVNGGTPDYKFSWSGPDGFTSNNQNLNGVKAGKYTLSVVDNNLCTSSATVEITQPLPLTIVPTIVPVSCLGANNGSISLQISGGKAPYIISWSNLGNGLVQEHLTPGIYTVTVADNNDCQKTLSITIAEPQLSISPTVTNVSCHGANDGSIQLNILGGIKPVTVVWSDDASAGISRNQLAPGIYSVMINDGAPCTINETFLISEPEEIKVDSKIQNAFGCDSPNTGSIVLTVSGGSAPYSYQWSNGAKTQNLQNVSSGNYYVLVTDAKGCTKSSSFQILRQKALSVNVVSNLVFDCTLRKLKRVFKATVDGGFAPYKIVWSTGQVTSADDSQVELTANSILTLNVTDSLGCNVVNTLNADVPSIGIKYSMSDCNKFSYSFNAYQSEVSLAGVSYLWDFGDGSTSHLANPIHNFDSAGNYKISLTVTTGSCSAEFEEEIYVDSKSRLSLDRTPKICKGDSLELNVSGAVSYRWSNGSIGSKTIISKAGNYSVIGTTSTGCTDTLLFEVSYYDTYSYSILSDSDNVSSGASLHLWSQEIPYSHYFWDFGDGKTSTGLDANHVFNVTKNGYYDVKLIVTNPNGCIEECVKRIWVKVPALPNTFSPNGDGINDLFMKDWEVKIYSRSGVLVYAGSEGWDGKYKGMNVSEGIYFYIVYYPSAEGTSTSNGFVRVIR